MITSAQSQAISSISDPEELRKQAHWMLGQANKLERMYGRAIVNLLMRSRW